MVYKCEMICVVIPVHNRRDFTAACLRSLLPQSGSYLQIIVVDDGSTDGTSEMLSVDFPDVEVIKGNGSLFWTASVNLGIRRALELGADYIMTMNNDTVASQDFIAQMLSWSIQYPNAILGALEINLISGKPHYGGEVTDWVLNTHRFLLDELSPEEQNGLHEVTLYPGRGLFIPKIVFEQTGLLEEKKLPHYMADYDFTQQARKHGFKVFCNYDAKLFTFPEQSGDFDTRKTKTLKNYWNHLFGIKGGGNLRNYTVYTLRNCPVKYIPPSLISGYLRRLVGFWIR